MTSSYVSLVHAALVGFESNNKYEVRNTMGQNVFYAVEENDCLSRQCCGPMRSFTIHVLDNFGQEIITITRPLKCMSCFFPCCLQEVSGNRFACSLCVHEITVFQVVFGHHIRYCLHLMSSSLSLYNTISCEDMTTNHTLFSHNPSLSWRCRLPPVTQWGMLYNSGTRSPLNSSWRTNTLSLYWRSMGPSVDGAAFQMLTLRWVFLNTETH